MATLAGVFDSVAAAERARAGLIEAGIAAERIRLSVDLTADGIAAEAPGQSYENQAWSQPASDTEAARANSAMRSGNCIVSVAAASQAERRRLAELMRRAGARGTLEQPA